MRPTAVSHVLVTLDDPEAAADLLLRRGASLVLVSLGAAGAFYAARTFRGEAPSFPLEEVVDATGAGDAFLAGTLAHLSQSPGWPEDEGSVREAVRRGNAAGAMACARFGAMQGLPTGDELERFMAVQS